jgi:general secretion pathway protein J
MGLFALIALAGFSLLDAVLQTQERTEVRLRRLSEIQRALFVVASDLDQISGRMEGTEQSLVFQKIDATGRPFVVRYDRAGAVLVRTVSGPAGERAQPLLEDVRDVRWSYQIAGAGWAPATPNLNRGATAIPGEELATATAAAVRGVAIDLTLAGPDGRPATVRRLIATAEVAP